MGRKRRAWFRRCHLQTEQSSNSESLFLAKGGAFDNGLPFNVRPVNCNDTCSKVALFFEPTLVWNKNNFLSDVQLMSDTICDTENSHLRTSTDVWSASFNEQYTGHEYMAFIADACSFCGSCSDAVYVTICRRKSPHEDLKRTYVSWTLLWNVNGRLKDDMSECDFVI